MPGCVLCQRIRKKSDDGSNGVTVDYVLSILKKMIKRVVWQNTLPSNTPLLKKMSSPSIDITIHHSSDEEDSTPESRRVMYCTSGPSGGGKEPPRRRRQPSSIRISISSPMVSRQEESDRCVTKHTPTKDGDSFDRKTETSCLRTTVGMVCKTAFLGITGIFLYGVYMTM